MQWFSIPSITDIVATTTPIIALMLTSLLPIIYFALAILIAVGAALFIRKKIGGGIRSVLGGRRRGRGRRRR